MSPWKSDDPGATMPWGLLWLYSHGLTMSCSGSAFHHNNPMATWWSEDKQAIPWDTASHGAPSSCYCLTLIIQRMKFGKCLLPLPTFEWKSKTDAARCSLEFMKISVAKLSTLKCFSCSLLTEWLWISSCQIWKKKEVVKQNLLHRLEKLKMWKYCSREAVRCHWQEPPCELLSV